jgi:flavin-dependent dehydrogenase
METLGAFDLIVVGGGVNGAGIARDAAGCGLSVLLVEKGRSRAGRVLAFGQAGSRRIALPRLL